MSASVAGWITANALLMCLSGVAMAQDAYPQGAVAFFNGPACPTGWGPAVANNNSLLNGFFLVPFLPTMLTATPQLLGATVDRPMGNGEKRTHTHSFQSSIEVPEVTYAGFSGSSNKLPSQDGSMTFEGTTGSAESGAPYVQLLVCVKTAFHRNQNPPPDVPEGVAMFFSTAFCPKGWKPTPATSGRFIAGLPAGGQPQAAFGGNPLGVAEDRTHTHTFSGNVTLGSTAVGLAPHGLAKHYGAAGQYGFQGITGPAALGLPYAIVIQCQPCTADDKDPACEGQ